MHITSLGHAGFLVETEQAIIVTDPWLSEAGAFDSGWMQLPRNHDLAPWVREKLETSPKARYIYISHEHKDHFDPEFLGSLTRRDFTAVVARFRHASLPDWFRAYGVREVAVLGDGESLPIPGGSLTLHLTDSGLNRDSSLLVRADGQTFLDLNDCKVHDRLAQLTRDIGGLDVFTAQFSGAIWHPTCYEYDAHTYGAISRKKMLSKFEAVARAIQTLKPRAFLASAGPVAFLDPQLMHINFQPSNIFPRAPRFFTYLRRRVPGLQARLYEPMPGDRLDVGSLALAEEGRERVTDENYEAYVRAYAERMRPLFQRRRRNILKAELEVILERLRAELQRKLDNLPLHGRVKVPLYMWLEEAPGQLLRVDFPARVVERVERIRDENRYALAVGASDILRVLDGKLVWEDFLLSFRLRLSRVPDAYDAILHGFLAVEAEALPDFCAAARRAEERSERATVSAGGKQYTIQRFCPHQGADLTQAWVEGGRMLTCPLHRWQFDLEKGGQCTSNATSIKALPCQVAHRERLEAPATREPAEEKRRSEPVATASEPPPAT